jgi:urease accessory protein
MLRATRIEPIGHRDATGAADCVVLDHHGRHRRRMTLTARGGLAFLLDLPGAIQLRDGDAIVLEDGRFVVVEAAPESLLEITASSAPELMRIAWHLGNRHTPVEMRGDRIRILNDHVLAEMVRGLGGRVHTLHAPFTPEGGAYGTAGAQYDHGHDHGHNHRRD